MSAARRKATDPAEARRNDLARIHIARKWATSSLGMNEGDYRSLVGTIAGETGCDIPKGENPSARYLDAHGRAELLRAFASLGWPDASARQATSDRATRRKGQTNGRYPVAGARGMVTQKQADLIAHLEDRLDWTDDPERLTGWITRQIEPNGDGTRKLTFVAALTRVQATTVITGMMVLAGDRLSGSRPSVDPARRWGRTARSTPPPSAAKTGS